MNDKPRDVVAHDTDRCDRAWPTQRRFRSRGNPRSSAVTSHQVSEHHANAASHLRTAAQ